MSHSNARWIALAAIAVTLVLLVPVVVGQPAPGAPTHGDDPISVWADQAHEWMGGDATDHHAGGVQHGDGMHHTGHDHHVSVGHDQTTGTDHDHATDTDHDHQDGVGNEIWSGSGHHVVNSSAEQTAASDRTDRRGGWGGCH